MKKMVVKGQKMGLAPMSFGKGKKQMSGKQSKFALKLAKVSK